MDSQTHWERIYGSKGPDAVSWYRPHLEQSLKLIRRATLATAAARIFFFIGGESVSTPAQSRKPSRTPRGSPPPSLSDEGPMQDCSALPHSVA